MAEAVDSADLAAACRGGLPARHRQAGYRSRLIAAGLTQVNVWVPASRRDELHAAALRLRLEVGLGLPCEGDPGQLDLFDPDHTYGARS